MSVCSTLETMVNRIPLTKARVSLSSVVKRAQLNGEYFLLEKDGIPVAGIMPADEFEDYLELKDPVVKKEIAASRKDYQAGRYRDVSEFVAELKAERKEKKVRK